MATKELTRLDYEAAEPMVSALQAVASALTLANERCGDDVVRRELAVAMEELQRLSRLMAAVL